MKQNDIVRGTKMAVVAFAVGAMLLSCGHKGNESAYGEETIDVAFPIVDSIVITKTYPGQLTACTDVAVVARVSGQLQSQSYDNGDYVRKGQVLFTIEDDKYKDAVHSAEAQLATAISEQEYAQSHYDAVKKAIESDAVSKMELNQAESSLEQAKASVKSAKAALGTARLNLSYCTITAPISGEAKVSALFVGNYVNGEVSPVTLTTIYDTSVLRANFSVEDDIYIKQKNSGNEFDEIPISFADTLKHNYYGKLSYVAPTVDSNTGTIDLQCDINNNYGELRPGMFVKVKLPSERLPKALLVKDASVNTDQSGKFMYVVNDSNKVVYTPIEVGPLYNDTLRVVYEGLTPSDRYVTKALLKVRDGMEVKPNVVK